MLQKELTQEVLLPGRSPENKVARTLHSKGDRLSNTLQCAIEVTEQQLLAIHFHTRKFRVELAVTKFVDYHEFNRYHMTR